MTENKKSMGIWFLSLLMGAIVGAGVALLMAPQSGEKTRSLIRDKSLELKDKALETADQTRTRAEKAIGELSEEARQRADELKKRGQDALENQRKNARKIVS